MKFRKPPVRPDVLRPWQLAAALGLDSPSRASRRRGPGPSLAAKHAAKQNYVATEFFEADPAIYADAPDFDPMFAVDSTWPPSGARRPPR